MNKEEALKEFGLNNKEIQVYLATLELGLNTVNEIAKKSGVFRTYCYDILKHLIEKGLICAIIKSGVQYFEALEVGKIIEIAREKEEKLRSILPELRFIQKLRKERPTVHFYEGKEGIRTIHDEIIKTKPSEILVYGNTQKHVELMEWNFPRFIRARVKNKITAKVITESTAFARKTIKRNEKAELRKTRFFPSRILFPTLKYIYKNKVVMIALSSTIMGVVIENKEIAEGEKKIFELLWTVAQK